VDLPTLGKPTMPHFKLMEIPREHLLRKEVKS